MVASEIARVTGLESEDQNLKSWNIKLDNLYNIESCLLPLFGKIIRSFLPLPFESYSILFPYLVHIKAKHNGTNCRQCVFKKKNDFKA